MGSWVGRHAALKAECLRSQNGLEMRGYVLCESVLFQVRLSLRWWLFAILTAAGGGWEGREEGTGGVGC